MTMDELLKVATERRASDIHIATGTAPLLRVHGKLNPLQGAPTLNLDDARALIYHLLSEEQRHQFEATFDFDCSFAHAEFGRFRVNVFMDRNGIAATLRVIPSKIPTMEQIELPKAATELIKHRNGLVLVTGPTGSGKSTTLAAMINTINQSRECHIVTVEDPIEFTYANLKAHINQREVSIHTKSFPAAIRSLLRQDLNVALIGELRDLETIAAALTIAETGHLVFATLHTVDAAQTVDRVVDVFPPYQQQQIRAMLAGTLRGVVCQQLLPRKDGQGRVAAREVLIVTPAVANLIRDGKTHQIYNAIQTGQQLGMITMQGSLSALLQRGLISPETAVAAGAEPKPGTTPAVESKPAVAKPSGA